MPVKIEKKVPGKTDCPHCLAKEGQLHFWGCSHHDCPFCGAGDMMCDCYNDMLELAMKPEEARWPSCLTAAHEKRWLELTGGLILQWQALFDSPFSEDDFLDECPPEWCHTDAQYKAYWKLQEKYVKLDVRLSRKWKILGTEEGRTPQIYTPSLCACCGALNPDMFEAPDEEWAKYVVPALQRKVLCPDCYNRQKSIFPEGWLNEQLEVQRRDTSDAAWAQYLAQKGIIPVCRLCGAQVPEVLPVTPTEIEKYVPPQVQDEILCAACFEKMRKLFPRGWKKAREPRYAVGAKGK